MTLIRRGDARWPAHVAASVSEGCCPNGNLHPSLRPVDPPWLYCSPCDTFWTVDGREETAEARACT